MPGRLADHPLLDRVQDVILHDGISLYILFKVYDPDNPKDYKYVVWADPMVEFHADIYDMVDEFLEDCGVTFECLGGGTIFRNSKLSTIEVYGTSKAVGKANHSIAANLIKRHFSHYESITWSD